MNWCFDKVQGRSQVIVYTEGERKELLTMLISQSFWNKFLHFSRVFAPTFRWRTIETFEVTKTALKSQLKCFRFVNLEKIYSTRRTFWADGKLSWCSFEGITQNRFSLKLRFTVVFLHPFSLRREILFSRNTFEPQHILYFITHQLWQKMK